MFVKGTVYRDIRFSQTSFYGVKPEPAEQKKLVFLSAARKPNFSAITLRTKSFLKNQFLRLHKCAWKKYPLQNISRREKRYCKNYWLN
jgi:hypothetical protein